MRKTDTFRVSVAVTAVFALVACDEPTEPGSAPEVVSPAMALTLPPPGLGDAGFLHVCKDSPDNAPFTFTYTIDSEIGDGVVSQTGSPLNVDAGSCRTIINVDATATTSQGATATVTETDPNNVFLGADVYHLDATQPVASWQLEATGLPNGVTVSISSTHGRLIVFRNKALPRVLTLPPPGLGDAGFLHVCKDSPDPIAFAFSYTIDSETGDGVVSQAGSPFSVDAGSCRTMIVVDATATTSQGATATVTETDPDNLFVGADVYHLDATLPVASWRLEATGLPNGVTASISNNVGRLIVFRNKALPPPLANEGCGHGYWKQHLASWPAAGYAPGQAVSSVFSGAAGNTLASQTLREALSNGGGSGTVGASRILTRAAIAALLNAAHPGVAYPRTNAGIIAAVNAALLSNNRTTMLALAEDLDADNSLGCPLN